MGRANSCSSDCRGCCLGKWFDKWTLPTSDVVAETTFGGKVRKAAAQGKRKRPDKMSGLIARATVLIS